MEFTKALYSTQQPPNNVWLDERGAAPCRAESCDVQNAVEQGRGSMPESWQAAGVTAANRVWPALSPSEATRETSQGWGRRRRRPGRWAPPSGDSPARSHCDQDSSGVATSRENGGDLKSSSAFLNCCCELSFFQEPNCSYESAYIRFIFNLKVDFSVKRPCKHVFARSTRCY